MPTSFNAMNHTPLETAAIHRSTADGRLCFLLADEGGWGRALTLYSSPGPEYEPEQSAFAATIVPGQEISFPDPAPGGRSYYHLCQNGQYLLTIAERVLPLAGVSISAISGIPDGRRTVCPVGQAVPLSGIIGSDSGRSPLSGFAAPAPDLRPA